MIEKNVGEEACDQLEILHMVVEFKKRFYPCKWANYDEILQGKCKLIPNKKALKIFEKDYEAMEQMFFKKHPSFQEIMKSLLDYEVLLNNKIEEKKNNIIL